jgi:hypothetical protein
MSAANSARSRSGVRSGAPRSAPLSSAGASFVTGRRTDRARASPAPQCRTPARAKCLSSSSTWAGPGAGAGGYCCPRAGSCAHGSATRDSCRGASAVPGTGSTRGAGDRSRATRRHPAAKPALPQAKWSRPRGRGSGTRDFRADAGGRRDGIDRDAGGALSGEELNRDQFDTAPGLHDPVSLPGARASHNDGLHSRPILEVRLDPVKRTGPRSESGRARRARQRGPSRQGDLARLRREARFKGGGRTFPDDLRR